MRATRSKIQVAFDRFRDRQVGFRFSAQWIIPLCCIVSTGCGHIFVRQDGVRQDGVRQEGCNVLPTSCGMVEPCQQACGAERLALMRAKLGWHGDRFKDSIGHSSEKVSECWYSSHLAQWMQRKREEANAPPPAKFHPIPTHPALFPEPESLQGTSTFAAAPDSNF